MHPSLSYQLATARAAAQRDALTRGARTHQLEHPAQRLPAAGRRLLTFLRARST